MKLNILGAFPYMTEKFIASMTEAKAKRHGILVDSGAFTAWKSGNPIEIKDYIAFIKGLPFAPDHYFNLDVIGDGEQSYQNFLILLDHGLKPIPVFTRGESWSKLERYYEHTDYVALGGLVGSYEFQKYIVEAHKVIAGRKVHWLGCWSCPLIARFRPTSCDSTSWAIRPKFASTSLYTKHEFVNLSKKSITKSLTNDRKIAIRKMGLNPESLLIERGWRGGPGWTARQLSARSYILNARKMEEKFGTKCFFAINASDYNYLELQANALELLEQEKGGRLDE